MAHQTEDLAALLAQEAGRRHTRRWAAALLVAAALAGGGLWWWLGGSGTTDVAYVTEPVTRGPLTVTVVATGTVQPTRQVEVSSELSGTLVSVDADYNDRVEAGGILARLDDTKLRAQAANSQAALVAARARVDQAQAALDEAQSNYEARGQLDRLGTTSRLDFIGYEAAYRGAKAALEIARADVTLAEAAASSVRSDLEKTAIRSPITGVVLDRAADPGKIVASSLNAPTLFVIAEDLAEMELRVDVDEADIGKVQVGNAARFTVDAYPGRSFAATITEVRFAPETTEGVVTYKAVLAVDNTDLALRPGMTATATITVAEIADALQVPNAALRYAPPQVAEDEGGNGGGLLGLIMPRRPGGQATATASGHAVWVLRDGSPAEVPVGTEASDGRRTVVTGEGIAEGDAVITDQSEAR
ncbi:efflux RND transporter periplasmic adaptor subunit [Albidovulum sp.]|uniref:efflux RND transporter periplasmic adaptor subunit n=1 Tax=Albidovulum sp. TaxID=1872424 RepID=UPI0039B8280B